MNPKIGFLIVLVAIIDCEGLSDKRQCGDPACEVPISEGRTVLRYFSNQDGMLSFKNNQPVTIFSKGAGQIPDLWGVEINGKRGYVNKAHIIEEKVLLRELKYEVSVAGGESGLTADPTPTTEEAPVTGESPIQHATPPTELLSSMIVERSVDLAGAHRSQVNMSPEDMEFNRIRATYTNTDGDYVLEAIPALISSSSTSVLHSTVSPFSSSMLFSSISAAAAAEVVADFEVIDGTTFRLNEPTTVKEEEIKPTVTQTHQQATASVEIESSIIPSDSSPAKGDTPEMTQPIEQSVKTTPPNQMQEEPKPVEQEEIPNPAMDTNIVDVKSEPQKVTEQPPKSIEVTAFPDPHLSTQPTPVSEAIPVATKDAAEVVTSNEGASQVPPVEASTSGVSESEAPNASQETISSVPETDATAALGLDSINVATEGTGDKVSFNSAVDVPTTSLENNQTPPTPSSDATVPEIVDDKASAEEQVAEKPEQIYEIVDDDDDHDDNTQGADDSGVEVDDDLDAEEEEDLDYEDEDEDLEGSLKQAGEKEKVKKLVEEELELHKEEEPTNKENIKKSVEEHLGMHTRDGQEPVEASAQEEALEGAGAENSESVEKLVTDQEPSLTPGDDLKKDPESEVSSGMTETYEVDSTGTTESTIVPDDFSSDLDDTTDIPLDANTATVTEQTNTEVTTDSLSEEESTDDGGMLSGWFGSPEDTTEQPLESNQESVMTDSTTESQEQIDQNSGLFSGETLTDTPQTFTDLPPSSSDDIKFYMPEDFAPSEQQAVTPQPEVSQDPPTDSEENLANPNTFENLGTTDIPPETITDQTAQAVTTEIPNVPESPEDIELPNSIPASDQDQDQDQDQDVIPQDVGMKEDAESETESPKSDIADTIEHYVEATSGYLPDWLHHALHGDGMNSMSPNLMLFLIVTALTLILAYLVTLIMDKMAREGPLKGKVSSLDSELFKAKNEILLLRKEMEESGKTASSTTVIQKMEPPAHLLEELDRLKEEKEKLLTELYQHQSEQQVSSDEVKKLKSEYDELKVQYDQTLQELADAESIVQECLEEKKNQKQVDNTELIRAIDTLRDQLNSQKEAVQKYEAKIKKRDSELKEKIQELRKQRADAANAKLQVEKLNNQHESLKKKLEEMESNEEELEKEIAASKQQISELENVKKKFFDAKEEIESKDSELEAKTTEVAVLKETIRTLEALTTSKSEDDADGWDVGDAVPDLASIQEISQLKVDLQKAQAACEKLNEDLTTAESSRDEFESKLKEIDDELRLARKIREQAVTEKEELQQKHQVLTSYFNQRESELLKQLGLQSSRLGDAEQGAESTAKRLTSLCEELESYKAQVKSLKMEMEEQERSLKAQNATLEKKQHESWVTARQESRRLTEAQTEMQTLRNRLTIAESKLVEREVEVRQLQEENNTLKESINTISQSKQDPFYTNGNGLHNLSMDSAPGPLATSSGLIPSGPSSLDEPPPELPILPILPPMMPQPPMIPPDSRPPPLGRRSPPLGRGRGYSRSPSPSSGGEYYGSSRRYRDVSPARSDRSRTSRSGRYDSYDSRYDRYSPSPPYRRDRSRDRSPDRYSSRSDRSDRHYRDYRDTPSRDLAIEGRRRSSRDGDFPGSGHDDYHHGNRRRRDGGRGDSLKEPKHGPKTSSPMVDQDGYNI